MRWIRALIDWLVSLVASWRLPSGSATPAPPSSSAPEAELDIGPGWAEENERDDPTVPSTPSTVTSTTTAPAELPATEPSPPEEDSTMKELRGKAVFIRQIAHLDTNPVEAARKYAGWGFNWCAPMITTSDGSRTNRQIEFYRECNALGVGVVPDWIRPKPGSWRGAIDDFFAFCDQLPFVKAVMFDPEEHWRDKAAEAAVFAAEFGARARQRGLKVILTTYAMPPSDFPMEEFAAVSDGGVSQTYYTTSSYGDRIFELSLARWRSRGFADKPIVLGAAFWQKYIDNPRTKSPAEWADFLSKVPPTPGLVIWPNQSWGGPVAPLLAMVKDWQPKVVPTGATALLLGLPFGEMIANAIFGG